MAEPIGGRPLDLITVGRSSVDLYGERVGGRLEDMGFFAKYVAFWNESVLGETAGWPAGILIREYFRSTTIGRRALIRGLH